MASSDIRYINITADQVEPLVQNGARLIDIREIAELEQVVPGAQIVPLSHINAGQKLGVAEGDDVIYHCRSGRRTRLNLETLLEAARPASTVYIVDEGIHGWHSRGLKLVAYEPTSANAASSIEVSAPLSAASLSTGPTTTAAPSARAATTAAAVSW